MIATLLALTLAVHQGPIPVSIVESGGKWTLLRNGKPYFVKGGGGTTNLDQLAAAGGNSCRIWGTENAAQQLDEAHRFGISMAVGIWLGHKEYFSYDNPAQVKTQYENVRKDILRLKDHPAVLLWGLGNEMEGSDNGSPTLWGVINDLAKLAKSLDPNHPTMTVVAEINADKIAKIIKYAPEIDVLGVNSYGGIQSIATRLKEYGWKKPYIVTEFGPIGPWERPKTAWGASFEPTSSEKAEMYRVGYEKAVGNQAGWCVGSYAFLWGHKNEETPTWFGLFLPTAERTEAIDTLTYLWTKQWPAHRAPKISQIQVSSSSDVALGATLSANVEASSPSGDHLQVSWTIREETKGKHFAGENEKAEPEHRPLGFESVDAKGLKVKFLAPTNPGAYRLFVTVRDDHGNGAVANWPFRVK